MSLSVRWCAPTLRALDALSADLLLAGLRLGERPPQRLAGLVDWRAGGALSSAIAHGLLPLEPATPMLLAAPAFANIALLAFFPCGPVDAAGELRRLDALLAVVEGLRPRRLVLEVEGLLLEPEGPPNALLSRIAAIEERLPQLEVLHLPLDPARLSSLDAPTRKQLQRRVGAISSLAVP